MSVLFEHAKQTVFYILLNFNFFSFSLFQKKFKVFELGANSSVPLKNIAGDSVAEDCAIFVLLTKFWYFLQNLNDLVDIVHFEFDCGNFIFTFFIFQSINYCMRASMFLPSN